LKQTTIKKNYFLRIVSVAAVILVLLTTGWISFQKGYGDGMTELQAARVEVKSPVGTISEIVLPDGSLVSLNAGSRIIYPSVFDRNREIFLEGEAYFDVMKNEAQPFVVKSSTMCVQVLGTKFNLQAYPQCSQTLLTLEEGSVEATTHVGENIEKLILLPNQQLRLDNQTGELKRNKVNTSHYTSWRKGNLIFRDIPLEDITGVLERYFNVTIAYKDAKFKQEKYYVTFDNQETLDEILELLSYQRNWKYTRNGQQIEIMKK